ncbi:MAG: tetratricopeptide repeat protein [Myxococcaceae bacterium]
MTQAESAEVEELVRQRKFADAAAACEARLANGGDPREWKLQRALVDFLNEDDVEAQYLQAMDRLASLVSEHPQDPGARFWFGYALESLSHDTPAANEQFQRALELQPCHPYANLALAGSPDDMNPAHALPLLTRALESQPDNFRLLREHADCLIASGEGARAREHLERILSREPYVEQGLGVANGFCNEVLTLSVRKDPVRAEARLRLGALDRASPLR